MRVSKKRTVSMRMSKKQKGSFKKQASETNAVNRRRRSEEQRRVDQASKDDSLELPALYQPCQVVRENQTAMKNTKVY